jgi:hypothetical protein
MYLFRAVDSAGQNVDFHLSELSPRQVPEVSIGERDNRPASFCKDERRSSGDSRVYKRKAN